jgi:hypothetical protein
MRMSSAERRAMIAGFGLEIENPEPVKPIYRADKDAQENFERRN